MSTFEKETQDYLEVRVPEVSAGIAEVFRDKAEFEFISHVPPLNNNPKLTDEIESYAQDV